VTLLAASRVSHAFAGVRALHDVDFEVERGEIHALVGENGAGKSTLMRIVGGAIAPDEGEVLLDRLPLPHGDPLNTRRLGVSVVYQEPMLVPELSVAENMHLGRERGRVLLRRGAMTRAAEAMLDGLGVAIPARTPVRELSVGQRQMVEIARALMVEAKVLILDEPTAALSAAETARLFGVLTRLRGRALGIIYISHRLDEVLALADRVTVLRDGRRVATAAARDLDRRQLIRWMVGRDVAEEFPPRTATPGAIVVEIEGLSHPPRVWNASLTVRQGEIVGVAGLVGAGRTSMALALTGALPWRATGGTVRLHGRPVRFRSPARALAHGVAYVTEDRQGSGIVSMMGADANITLAHLASYSRAGVLRVGQERAAAADAARDLDIRAASLRQPAATLSGGNQQKLLLARYLVKRPRLLILDEPTRGVDVGARMEIYRLMNRLSWEGLSILLISSDLPEAIGMSDRLVVLRDGRLAGELDRGEATPDRVMALATGRAS
jgi:ABC-type sugar transport system ATPase subunit